MLSVCVHRACGLSMHFCRTSVIAVLCLPSNHGSNNLLPRITFLARLLLIVTTETEDYVVDLQEVCILELTIDPDRGAGEALATLADWRLA